MSLREAAQMALEALKSVQPQNMGPEIYPAIQALRAAMAEACTYPDCKCPIDKGETCAMGKAEAPKAETYLDQIEQAKGDMAQWPQWMQDAAHVSAAVARPPAREAELSDKDILYLWGERTDFAKASTGEILEFARAVLAAARGKAAPTEDELPDDYEVN